MQMENMEQFAVSETNEENENILESKMLSNEEIARYLRKTLSNLGVPNPESALTSVIKSDMKGNPYLVKCEHPSLQEAYVLTEYDPSQGTNEYKLQWFDDSFEDGVRYLSLTKVSLSSDIAEKMKIIDEGIKKVTPRTPQQYAQEFKIPFKEIWPAEKDLLVIGDPYQQCDLPNTTLIDYEYIDEILPPMFHVLHDHRKAKHEGNRKEVIHRDISNWFDELHSGNLMAIEKSQSFMGIKIASHLDGLLDEMRDILTDVVNKHAENKFDQNDAQFVRTISEEEWKTLDDRWRKFSTLAQKVKDSNWKPEDFTHLPRYEDPYEMEALKTGYSISIRNNPTPEDIKKQQLIKLEEQSKWLSTWKKYWDGLPQDTISKNPELQKALENVKHCVNELGDIRQNIGKGRGETLWNMLCKNYGKLKSKAFENIPNGIEVNDFGRYFTTNGSPAETQSPWNLFEFDPDSLDDNTLFPPNTWGNNLNRRVQLLVDESIDTVSRFIVYFKSIFPKLLPDEKELASAGISETSRVQYTSTYEKPLIREMLFRLRAKHAVPLHGYFPYDMPEIQPKDRILALYSVSTHVWDSFKYSEQFEENIRASLSFLKTGGQYILGPVNYRDYRLRRENPWSFLSNYSFAGNELEEALSKLQKEGIITYEFIDSLSSDPSEFKTGDSAASLIITKIK